MLASRTVLPCLFLILAGTVRAAAPVTETPTRPPLDPHSMGPVVLVGPDRIGAEQVFELWTPIWYETLAKVRNGKLSAADGDAKLNEEWRHAITALVKDEAFFQEAEREHNSFINNIVENAVRQGAAMPRNQIAAEVRKAVQQDMDRFFRQFNAEMIKEAGGTVKLHKVLNARGLTFAEWQNRLKKKAFTQSYLHQILKPRAPDPGPKQVQDYYAAHTDEFALPGLVKFRHIFFSNAVRGEEKAREDAAEVWESLEDGSVTFEAAAAQYSDDSESKARGGSESGEEATDPEREAWLADVRKAIREEKPDELGPILESPFGCHIAVLISIGPDRKVPFGEVRRDIEQKLQNRIWEAETDRYFLSIKKSLDIRILIPNFPPSLSCATQAGMDTSSPTFYHMTSPEIRTSKRQPRTGGQ